MLRMDTTRPSDGQLGLHPFRAMRLAESYVGAPVAYRVFARPYRAVPGRLLDWRRRRHLRVDADPAFYVHEYTAAGVSVRGIVANLELPPPPRAVLPHEQVHPAQVKQLANRMEMMSLNPAPILLLHEGAPDVRRRLDQVMDSAPHLSYTDRAEQLHRLWRIPDTDVQEALATALGSARTVIADGHHRYQAALELAQRHPGTAWDRTLVMVIDQADTPLQLCAIHRTIAGLTLSKVAAAAQARGDSYTEHADRQEALEKLDHALVLHDGLHWASLRPVPGTAPPVCVLHNELLPAWNVSENRLDFHHTASGALARAGSGLAVLLPAPRFGEIVDWASTGRLLPQKATSFQPKPHVGVVMRDLRDG